MPKSIDSAVEFWNTAISDPEWKNLSPEEKQGVRANFWKTKVQGDPEIWEELQKNPSLHAYAQSSFFGNELDKPYKWVPPPAPKVATPPAGPMAAPKPIEGIVPKAAAEILKRRFNPEQPLATPMPMGRWGQTPGQPAPIGSIPILDAPVVGAEEIGKGAARAMAPHPGETTIGGAGAVGLHQVIGGIFKTLEPAIAAGALVAPLHTFAGLGLAMALGHLTPMAAKKLGVKEDVADLLGDAATLATGLVSGWIIRGKTMGARKAMDAAEGEAQAAFARAEAASKAGDYKTAAKESVQGAAHLAGKQQIAAEAKLGPPLPTVAKPPSEVKSKTEIKSPATVPVEVKIPEQVAKTPPPPSLVKTAARDHFGVEFDELGPAQQAIATTLAEHRAATRDPKATAPWGGEKPVVDDAPFITKSRELYGQLISDVAQFRKNPTFVQERLVEWGKAFKQMSLSTANAIMSKLESAGHTSLDTAKDLLEIKNRFESGAFVKETAKDITGIFRVATTGRQEAEYTFGKKETVTPADNLVARRKAAEMLYGPFAEQLHREGGQIIKIKPLDGGKDEITVQAPGGNTFTISQPLLTAGTSPTTLTRLRAIARDPKAVIAFQKLGSKAPTGDFAVKQIETTVQARQRVLETKQKVPFTPKEVEERLASAIRKAKQHEYLINEARKAQGLGPTRVLSGRLEQIRRELSQTHELGMSKQTLEAKAPEVMTVKKATKVPKAPVSAESFESARQKMLAGLKGEAPPEELKIADNTPALSDAYVIQKLQEGGELGYGEFTGEGVLKALNLPPETSLRNLVSAGILEKAPSGLYQFNENIRQNFHKLGSITVEASPQDFEGLRARMLKGLGQETPEVDSIIKAVEAPREVVSEAPGTFEETRAKMLKGLQEAPSSKFEPEELAQMKEPSPFEKPISEEPSGPMPGRSGKAKLDSLGKQTEALEAKYGVGILTRGIPTDHPAYREVQQLNRRIYGATSQAIREAAPKAEAPAGPIGLTAEQASAIDKLKQAASLGKAVKPVDPIKNAVIDIKNREADLKANYHPNLTKALEDIKGRVGRMAIPRERKVEVYSRASAMFMEDVKSGAANPTLRASQYVGKLQGEQGFVRFGKKDSYTPAKLKEALEDWQLRDEVTVEDATKITPNTKSYGFIEPKGRSVLLWNPEGFTAHDEVIGAFGFNFVESALREGWVRIAGPGLYSTKYEPQSLYNISRHMERSPVTDYSIDILARDGTYKNVEFKADEFAAENFNVLPIIDRGLRRQGFSPNKEAGFLLFPSRSEVVGAFESVGSALSSLRERTAPGYVSEVTEAKGIMREMLGGQTRRAAQLEESLRPEIERWDKVGNPDTFKDFTYKIERPETIGPDMDPRDEALRSSLREILDSRREEIRNLGEGKLEHYMTNYFPHIWDRPSAAKSWLQGKVSRRPLEADKGYFRQREIEFIKEGMERSEANGGPLKPLTYNPVAMALIRAHQMDKFITSHKMFDQLDQGGFLSYVKRGQEVPEGYAPIDDAIFQHRRPIFDENQNLAGTAPAGQYVAPVRVAKIINNYLRPGLRGEYTGYDSLRRISNTLNMAQLGLSGFHFSFVSMDAAVSDAAVALSLALQGKPIKAIGPAIRSVTMTSPAYYWFKGNELLKSYMDPVKYQKYADLAEQLEKSNMNVGLDAGDKNDGIVRFMREWKAGSWKGIGMQAVPAFYELAAKPLMQWYVPRVKLGAFATLAEAELGKLGKDATPAQIRKTLSIVADAVEDRMGQLNYDNLHWSRKTRDALMLLLRAPGWKIGSTRVVAGAIKDTAESILTTALHGLGKGEVTPRMAYAVMLPLVTAVYGTYLYMGMHKGQLPSKEELKRAPFLADKDVHFPPTGKVTGSGLPERMAVPSYIKDIEALVKGPATVGGILTNVEDIAVSSANPIVGAGWQLATQQDRRQRRIWGPDATAGENLKGIGTWAASEFSPISGADAVVAALANKTGLPQKLTGKEIPFNTGTNAAKVLRNGGSIPAAIATVLTGVNPAPAYVGMSNAAEVAERLYREDLPAGAKSREGAEQQENKRLLISRQINGTATDEDIQRALERGEISEKDVEDIDKIVDSYLEDPEANTPFLRHVKHLSLENVFKVWDAATPEERAQLRDIIEDKEDQLEKFPKEKREKMQRKFDSIISPGPMPVQR